MYTSNFPNIDGASHQQDTHGNSLLHVETPHALIQAAGYLKHTAEPWERVLFRGQDTLYNTLRPSLYRGISSQSTQASRNARVKQIVIVFSESAGIFDNIPDYAHEGLLQHYGIQTSWLDVVDNVWVAIWFAVHRAYEAGKILGVSSFRREKENRIRGIWIYIVDCGR